MQNIKGTFPKCPWQLLMALGCQSRAPGLIVLCSLLRSLEPWACFLFPTTNLDWHACTEMKIGY